MRSEGGRTPTDEQIDAIQSDAPSLTIAAAAGSGKTFVLVQRHLRHVMQQGISPDRILTITFTRKAAAEMKERIVRRLREEGLATAAQIAETGPIQTIHSFCERLLRENSLLAGIDPDFDVLGEARAIQLRRLAIRSALTHATEDSQEAERFVAEFAGHMAWDEETEHSQLIKSIDETLKSLRESGRAVEEFEELYATPESALRHWRLTLWQSLPPHVLENLPLETLDDGFSARLKEAGVKGSLATNTEDLDKVAAEWACGLVHVVGSAWRNFERLMEESQEFDFTWLELRANRLLRESDAIRERLREQYDAILVDEAQDMNALQFDLVESLAIDREMLVGDAQQSIYGFRLADSRRFIKRALEPGSKRLSKNARSTPQILAFVDRVFRERSGYAGMSNPSRSGPFHVAEELALNGIELWVAPNEDSALAASHIRDLVRETVAQGGYPSGIAVLVRNKTDATKLLGELRRLNVEARIVGGTERFYTRLEVRDVANALEALTNPRDDFALLALLRSPFVGLSMDSLVLLGQGSGILEALRCVELESEEDGEKLEEFVVWFDDLSTYTDRLTAWEGISELFSRTPFLENLARRPNGLQEIANVRKLLTLAVKEPEMGPVEFAYSVRSIQEFRHQEGDAPAADEDENSVTILTIHKSKGLEFDTVVLPNLYRPMKPPSSTVLVEATTGMVVPRREGAASMFFTWLKDRKFEREMDEEWRVLYVAMTRARSRLCVAVQKDHPNMKCFAGILGKALCVNGEFPPGVKVRSSVHSV